jgi:hypothetical protein
MIAFSFSEAVINSISVRLSSNLAAHPRTVASKFMELLTASLPRG